MTDVVVTGSGVKTINITVVQPNKIPKLYYKILLVITFSNTVLTECWGNIFPYT